MGRVYRIILLFHAGRCDPLCAIIYFFITLLSMISQKGSVSVRENLEKGSPCSRTWLMYGVLHAENAGLALCVNY